MIIAARKYHLTTEFLAALAEERHEPGTGKLLQIQELLARLPDEVADDDLRDALISLVAQNPQQQARLYEVFEACRQRVNDTLVQEDTAKQSGQDVENETTQATNKWRWRIAVPAVLLLLAVGYAWWIYHQPTPVVLPPPPVPAPDTTVTTMSSPTDTFLFKNKEIPYITGHDITPFLMPPPVPWKAWFVQNWWWARLVLATLFVLLLVAIWRYRSQKRRQLIAEHQPGEKPPYHWNIRFENVADVIVMGDDFPHTLHTMRRRGNADLLHLDLPRTIKATVESGGMPEFKYRRQTAPVEYLLLIERQHAYNHRARLFDSLYKVMQEQEIEIARFFYDSDLRVCFDENNEFGISLSDLQHRFPAARLMIVGSGAQAIHPRTGKPAPFTGIFGAWKHRVLFTPKPLAQWGRDERHLEEIFTVLPATFASLDYWLSELENGQDAHFGEWREKIQDAPLIGIAPPDDADPIPFLRQHFPTRIIRWMAACAIYPSLHWDLTLWLGRWLEPADTADNDPLTTADHLLAISRLSWFIAGKIPDDARRHLVEWLDKEDHGLHLQLRADLAAALALNPPPADSVAADEFQLQIALSEWVAIKDKDKARARELEKEIARSLERGNEADITVLRYLQAPRPGTLDFIVPEAWKKFVHPASMPALGWMPDWKDMKWLIPILTIGLFLIFYPWRVILPACAGGETTWQDKPYCLDQPFKKLIFEEIRLRDTIRMGSTSGEADRFRMDSLGTGQDSLLRECNANIAVTLYNKGVSFYEDGQRDSACAYFKDALRFDSLDFDIVRAAAWCRGTTAVNPNKIAPAITGTVSGQGNLPLNGVLVTGTGISLTTDAKGRYVLRLPSDYPRPDIRLRFTKIGYKTTDLVLTVNGVTTLPTVSLSEKESPTNPADNTTTDTSATEGGTATEPPSGGITTGGNPVTDPGTSTSAPPSTSRAIAPKMIEISGGTFKMGCTSEQQDCNNDEKPAHNVTVGDFRIGQFELTFEEYDAFCEATQRDKPEDEGWGRSKRPVINISWFDATDYCNWLSEQEGLTPCYSGTGDNRTCNWNANGYRLPTEAEWEYAARERGKQVLFGNGKNIIDPKEINFDASADYKKDYSVVGEYRAETVPVGSLNSPNALGLHDMSGNVDEWCCDWNATYTSDALSNPKGPNSGSDRVLRGGSWYDDPQDCRVAVRDGNAPVSSDFSVGCRLARTN